MGSSNRKGQALIEIIILSTALAVAITFMCANEKSIKRRYDAYKAQRKVYFPKKR